MGKTKFDQIIANHTFRTCHAETLLNHTNQIDMAPSNHRLVLDGIFWIARTGAQWRDLPEEFGKWSSVYRQFRRWTLAGLWEFMLETLNASGAKPAQVQMIDSTIIRAHHQAAGAKGGLKKKVLAVQKVALRPRFI